MLCKIINTNKSLTCATEGHIIVIIITLLLDHFIIYTTTQKFGVFKLFGMFSKEIYTFI